jgi:PAS domain S-box-containing protein
MILQDIAAPAVSPDHTLDWPTSDLLQALPVAVYTTDAAGLITAYNDAAAELWGTRPELGSDRWCGSWRLYWPDGTPMDHGECPMAVTLTEGREIRGAEAMAERPDGTRVPFLAFPTLLRDAAGRIAGAVNTLVDITEQKRDAEIRQRLSAIVASSHDAIISKDLDGVVATWNKSAERVFGYTAEEAVGKSITILMPDDRKDEERLILERIRNGEMVDHFETIRVRKDGSRVPISLTISPVRSDDGRIIGVSKIARDITDEKESRDRIQTLMQEVNHRVKNQFAVILSMVRETSRSAKSLDEFERQVQERIMALSRSHDLLVDGEWRGATIFDLLASHIRPFGDEGRVSMSGPLLTLQPIVVQYLGIAFHELATNSAKYGALSQPGGAISVEWTVDGSGEEKRFGLVWTETGGPELGPCREAGFGSIVLQRLAPAAVNGTGTIEYRRDGVTWRLEAPLESLGSERDAGIAFT